ncbi:hypothetical protein MASR2M70_12100 [Bacillota bacterium]
MAMLHSILRRVANATIGENVYLNRLPLYKNECGIKLYAYCLMSNHVRLLVKEGGKEIDDFMKKLGASCSYA